MRKPVTGTRQRIQHGSSRHAQSAGLSAARLLEIAPLTTAIGSGLAYLHAVGYADAFGISRDWIALDIPSVILPVLLVAFCLVICGGHAAGLALGLKETDLKRRLKSILPPAIIISLLLLGVFLDMRVGILMCIVLASLFFIGRTVFLNWVPADTNSAGSLPIYQVLGTELMTKSGTMFSLVLVAGILAYALGNLEAKIRIDFPTRSDRENAALLRTYGEWLIYGKFDSKTHVFTGEITRSKQTDGQELELRLTRLIPLCVSSPKVRVKNVLTKQTTTAVVPVDNPDRPITETKSTMAPHD